jgi:LacI family transcriptional regulator
MVSNRKRATQWDVARKAGVSQATVSLVLGGTLLGGRAKTTARVLKVAGELGYRPNRSAQALRTGRTRTIAVVVPDICNPFFPSLLKGAQSVADDAGYDVITLNTAGQRDAERRILRWGIEGRVDGVIGVFFTLQANEFRPLLDAGVGVVRVESTLKKQGLLPIDNLFVDNRAAAAAATRFLIERGHSQIAMLAGPDGPQAARAEGYLQALAERGLKADIVTGSEFNEVGGRMAAASVLARRNRPSAFFAANDLMAIGAMAALRDAGVAVPGDMAVMGFDDIFIARLVSPSLTTVSQFQHDIGVAAAEILLERLRGSGPKPGVNREMPYRLIVRESA